MIIRKLGATLALVIAGLSVNVLPAQAAGDGGDNRPCVTKGEYRTARTGWTSQRVNRWFDTTGTRIGVHHGGEWIDDGYWEDVWVEDYYYDEWLGEWVDDGYWTQEWVDDWYFERDYRDDTVRSYRKCSAWGPGGRYVGVNYDNYSFTSYGLFGFRAYDGVPADPWSLIWWDQLQGRQGTGGSVDSKGEAPEKSPVTPGPLR